MIPATPNNMRDHARPGLVMIDADGAVWSADSGDYWNCAPNAPVSPDSYLAVRVSETFEPLEVAA